MSDKLYYLFIWNADKDKVTSGTSHQHYADCIASAQLDRWWKNIDNGGYYILFGDISSVPNEPLLPHYYAGIPESKKEDVLRQISTKYSLIIQGVVFNDPPLPLYLNCNDAIDRFELMEIE